MNLLFSARNARSLATIRFFWANTCDCTTWRTRSRNQKAEPQPPRERAGQRLRHRREGRRRSRSPGTVFGMLVSQLALVGLGELFSSSFILSYYHLLKTGSRYSISV